MMSSQAGQGKRKVEPWRRCLPYCRSAKNCAMWWTWMATRSPNKKAHCNATLVVDQGQVTPSLQARYWSYLPYLHAWRRQTQINKIPHAVNIWGTERQRQPPVQAKKKTSEDTLVQWNLTAQSEAHTRNLLIAVNIYASLEGKEKEHAALLGTLR